MINLLKVDFKSLFKLKAVKWAILGAFVFSILLSLQSITDKTPAFENFFNGAIVVNLLSVAVGGLYINNDFSQNTIRNKIVIGYTRTKILFSKVIVVFCFYLLTTLAAWIPAFCINYFMLETDNVLWEAITKGILLSIYTLFNNMAITILLGVSARNATGAILPVFLAEAIPVAGMLLLEVLSVSDAEQLFNFVKAVPNIAIMILSPYTVPENMYLSLITTAVFCCGCLLLGLLTFNQAELS